MYFGGFILHGLLCGWISNKIAKTRGFSNNFFWGFFLGGIGILIVFIKLKTTSTKKHNWQ